MRKAVSQALRFGIVGLSNTAITYLSFLLLHRVFRLGENPSNVISYLLGLANSFVWNKKWTFGAEGFRLAEVLFFIIVFIASWALQFLAFRLLIGSGMPAEGAQALAMVFYTATNFLGNKFLTFRRQGDGT